MNDNKAFLVVGRDHKVIFWSDELAKLTGHAAEDIVGGNIGPDYSPGSTNEALRRIRKSMGRQLRGVIGKES